jgi:hypothetical protein
MNFASMVIKLLSRNVCTSFEEDGNTVHSFLRHSVRLLRACLLQNCRIKDFTILLRSHSFNLFRPAREWYIPDDLSKRIIIGIEVHSA